MIYDKDMTVIYYTANLLEDTHPKFVARIKDQLRKASDGLPIISVSHEPLDFGKNICVGDIGRSHLNIYKQILIGCKEAETKYVAMAEDDILYSWEHFHCYRPKENIFGYNMSKWSIFTWTKPPTFSYRHRRVVNSLIAPRDMLVAAMEERFKRLEVLKAEGRKEENIIKFWGDPGRYEDYLGVTIRQTQEFNSSVPNIVYSHEDAYGFISRGKRKALGNPRAYVIPDWGKADKFVEYFYEK